MNKLEECEGEEENETLSHSHVSNTSLVDLNMLLVILSLDYLSNEDDWHEENEHIITDHVAVNKKCISKLQTKKREKHEPKLFGGKRSCSSRFQTTIKDSRHGRRM
ncbi:hypothetical protein MtrunA17_Chr7g0275451 [Medicago truncatula]|uniref:Uncharacterized protein n=1 Tax=Medicago truncatula TaxID=3880 RepID=A0A396HE00_MEDTR|nr:hypothetical protein MtrunA17_Chr7g0275451 [Medicago truncatula]